MKTFRRAAALFSLIVLSCAVLAWPTDAHATGVPGASKWTPRGHVLIVTRLLHTATRLPNGGILVAGGFEGGVETSPTNW